jgi:hypothetical protein
MSRELKIVNDTTLFTPLNTQILNYNREIDTINFT